MAAMNPAFKHHNTNCSTAAAGCSSALICNRMDTAMILVVSIFVCLVNIRLCIG